MLDHLSQELTLKIAGIVNDSVTDGPGIRYSLFLQGCPHSCKGCHNPSSIPLDGGRIATINTIFNDIKANPLLTGVTFSGGEPLLQARPLTSLAKMIKEIGLELAIYTGYVYEDIINLGRYAVELISYADIIIDGPFIENLKSLDLRFKGSKNQRVINVKMTLENNNNPIIDTTKRWE
ncbi:MAG: anaerobic ribonucleoside-triphosphate reductase activating protein [Christensenellaceae bacterium]|jgi:anaerobic ribonucleoside-triphosphate reductase activating protein|nr:anaerobic ribonucleoside-triphosphate reductase activating protein [Christensenellaceae bacterium]